MRSLMLAAALLLAASCGGSPMAPSTPSSTTPPSASTPTSGLYLLTVGMSTSGSSGVSTCVGGSINGAPPPLVGVFVTTPVTLERSDNTITITPQDQSATFRMELQLAGANLAGTAGGKFKSSATTVTVSGTSSGGSAIVAGIVGQSGPYVVSGALTGTVSTDPGLSCTNNGHTWTLMPR